MIKNCIVFINILTKNIKKYFLFNLIFCYIEKITITITSYFLESVIIIVNITVTLTNYFFGSF